MKVQKVLVEGKPYPLYILLDKNFEVVEPVKRFIKYLDNTGKAPNTIKTYSYHLKLFYEFMGQRRIELDDLQFEEFAKFKEILVTNNGSILELNEEESEVENTDLQWFKKNINAQALPNGYCRLPVIAGPCPYVNACLDCINFCTSKQFLNEHEEHLERTKQLLDRAKQNQW